jgi:hypothetical protein
MSLKVGLLVGREWSFPPALIEEMRRRDAGVEVELVKLGGTAMDEPCPYSVLIDRISHEVPYYRSYLKHAVLQGVTVVNNPFMWTADDKFFGASLATKLGIAHPKTIALPNREYVPGIVHTESLRNLIFPLDWDAILDYIGLPCILKDAHGGGWKEVYVCRTKAALPTTCGWSPALACTSWSGPRTGGSTACTTRRWTRSGPASSSAHGLRTR